jgi:hypothetical protein
MYVCICICKYNLILVKCYADLNILYLFLIFECIKPYYGILFLFIEISLQACVYIFYVAVFRLLLLIWLFPYLVKDLQKNKWHEHEQ